MDDSTRPDGPGFSPNVLVVAAGRRTSLVQAFVDAARTRGGVVVAGDVDPLAPSMFIADAAARLERVSDERYLPRLLEVIAEHHIGLVVPTIDTDLGVLAAQGERFAAAGCRVAISTPDFIQATADKYDTGRVFGSAGIRVPMSWLPAELAQADLPERVFIKPRRGSASQDVRIADRQDLDAAVAMVPDPVVQPVLSGPEITIDALLDLAGRPIHFVPRLRIKTIGGESVQGVTLAHDEALERWIVEVLEISSGLGAAGPLTLQAFLTEEGPVLTEINARFGGGFPLAHAAGADYPAWLLDMVEGRPVEPRLGDYEPGLFMTRTYVERFVREPRW